MRKLVRPALTRETATGGYACREQPQLLHAIIIGALAPGDLHTMQNDSCMYCIFGREEITDVESVSFR